VQRKVLLVFTLATLRAECCLGFFPRAGGGTSDANAAKALSSTPTVVPVPVQELTKTSITTTEGTVNSTSTSISTSSTSTSIRDRNINPQRPSIASCSDDDECLQNKVAFLHKSPLSITATISVEVRNKLDYKLSRFSSPLSPGSSSASSAADSSSQPIIHVTLKEFLAMLLNSRQRGRMTGSVSLEIYPLHTLADNDAANGPVEDGTLDQLFWNDRPVQGVLMSGIEPEPKPLERRSPSSRICVFGCMRNGIHQWLTGTK